MTDESVRKIENAMAVIAMECDKYRSMADCHDCPMSYICNDLCCIPCEWEVEWKDEEYSEK